jgi:hypothetical protein
MNVLISDHFKRQIKKLTKKYPNVKDDFLAIIDNLDFKNEISIGKNIYKIRISSSDIKKGKSGGFRSYIYLYIKKDLAVPLCIYAKAKTENISQNELKFHFDQTMRSFQSPF